MVRNDDTCCDELARLGAILRTARLNMHMTQDVLAEKSGVSKRYITHIEKGRANPSYTILRMIASALEFSADALFCSSIDYDGANETLLLSIYRACSEEQKKIVLSVVKTLAENL